MEPISDRIRRVFFMTYVLPFIFSPPEDNADDVPPPEFPVVNLFEGETGNQLQHVCFNFNLLIINLY